MNGDGHQFAIGRRMLFSLTPEIPNCSESALDCSFDSFGL